MNPRRGRAEQAPMVVLPAEAAAIGAGGSPPAGAQRRASLMLVLACALWGASFTWVKHAQAGMAEASGYGPGETLWVPVLYIGWRFALAALLWAALFPGSLRGWTLKSLRRTCFVGALLALGMILQLLGLDRTSQSTCAFLTSLTIVFTPLNQWLFLRRPPPRRMLVCVALGALGVYLMAAAGRGGMKPDELLGVAFGIACAAAFSLHIVAVAHYGREEDPRRLSLGQFLTLGVLGLALPPAFGASLENLSLSSQHGMLTFPGVGINLVLATVFATLGAFGLMFRYQPRVSATRGAVIYQTEPIFASAYAWVLAGSGMTRFGIAGAAAILSANLVAELYPRGGER